MTRYQAIQKLAGAIRKEFGKPWTQHLFTTTAKESPIYWRDTTAPSLCWEDGPYEWAACFSLDESVYCGELGKYGMPLTGRLAEVKKEINDAGFYFECQNNFTVSVYPV